MTNLEEQFEDLYGPLAPFSDFKKGEHITYRAEEGQTRTGTIIWVATATRIAGRDIPVQYIVECDQHSGIPDRLNTNIGDTRGKLAILLEVRRWLHRSLLLPRMFPRGSTKEAPL